MNDDSVLQQAEALVPTSAADWKKGSKTKGIGSQHEVRLPSGNVALLRRMGVETFLKVGLIPNSLVSIVQEQITAAKGGAEPDEEAIGEEMTAILDDPKKLQDVFDMADGILVLVCAQPRVHKTPGPEEERDAALLYADEVDMEDKMFIFTWAVGGAEDAASFRKEQSAMLGRLGAVEGVPHPPE